MQLTSTHTISPSPKNECMFITSSWIHLSFWSGRCVEAIKIRTNFTCIGVGDKWHFFYMKNIPRSTSYYFWELLQKMLPYRPLHTYLLDELRSWGAGLKPFTLSLILLQCHPGSGGILWGHYSWLKIVNIGVKIVPVNILRLVLNKADSWPTTLLCRWACQVDM